MKIGEPLLAPPAGNLRMIWSSEVAALEEAAGVRPKATKWIFQSESCIVVAAEPAPGARREAAAEDALAAKTYRKLNYNLRQIRIFCPGRNADAPGGLGCVTDKLLW